MHSDRVLQCNPTKAKLAKIKTFNESVNRPNQIVLGQ